MRPDGALVLLAFGAAQLLRLIPATPGGLGFVEAGLVGLLVLAGVDAATATVATLSYRLISYWVPLPVGLVAYVLASHRNWSKATAARRRMSQMTITFLILAAAVVVFVWDRLPVAIVALGVALSLWATGVLDLDQALGGFGDPTVIFIATLFVVSEGLDASGVTAWLGQQLIERVGDSRTRLIVYTLLLVAGLTALINANGSVAALLPVADRHGGATWPVARPSSSCRSRSAPMPGRCWLSRGRP